ncbi:energy transducer TonB [Allosphingosinicella indica]|uniref:Protein TonB n=1 Tax=Allosphingosinicella indica TaxID=941907 RepID=A0A1X7G643_9SPHN|nr:energy transducer TonB [Allosphingosinicella indica]SMF64654.1 outer membrane transport energization protein TonB [Allosphingosinicella indica]
MELHGYRPRRGSPATVVVVIAVHAAALTALALAKMDMPIKQIIPPLKTKFVLEEVTPPENPPEKIEPKIELPQTPVVDRIVDVPPVDRIIYPPLPERPLPGPVDEGVGKATIIPTPMPAPTPDPVRVDARMDRGSVLQPPYPPSAERQGIEGRVQVRLTIGADGRVKAVERIAAPSDSLFEATQRHALRAWRFRPATVDGRAVESSLVMTVIFQIRG